MKRILVFLLLVSVCFGANEIQIRETTGQTDLYAVVMRNSDMAVMNGTTPFAFDDSPTTGEWANYEIGLTEHTAVLGLYYATMPTSTAGKYSVHCYKGASPAATDTFLQGFYMDWSGTSEKTFANVDVGYREGKSLTGTVTVTTTGSVLGDTITVADDTDFEFGKIVQIGTKKEKVMLGNESSANTWQVFPSLGNFYLSDQTVTLINEYALGKSLAIVDSYTEEGQSLFESFSVTSVDALGTQAKADVATEVNKTGGRY